MNESELTKIVGIDKEQAKWLAFAFLVVILIGTILLQVQFDFSEGTLGKNEIGSGFAEETPRIEAIAIADSGESCISVEGNLAHEGDTINGFRILKIYAHGVQFEKNGKTWVRTIPENQKSVRSKFNNLLRQRVSSEQVGYEGFNNYYKQYGQLKYSKPYIAENGSYYGQISEATGRPKTVYVRGYYRKDGTYVRSHYRSPPRR